MQRTLVWLLAAALILGLSACAYSEDTYTDAELKKLLKVPQGDRWTEGTF